MGEESAVELINIRYEVKKQAKVFNWQFFTSHKIHGIVILLILMWEMAIVIRACQFCSSLTEPNAHY